MAVVSSNCNISSMVQEITAGHEITIEVCKFLYEANNLDFYHLDSFSSQFYSICKIYFL